MSLHPAVAQSFPAGPLRILRSMPHRHPMLLVDDVEDSADEHCAVAYKNITFNEPCFRDAGSDSGSEDLSYPISLLVESFGQGAGLLLSRRGFLDQAGSTSAVVFGHFENIEFVSPAHPGDRLRHEVRLIQATGNLVVLGGHTSVGDRIIARYGSLKAFLVPTSAIAKRSAE